MRFAVWFCLVSMLAVQSTHALDPLKADILLLKLGMTEAEVREKLATQGAQAMPGAANDADTIVARAKDGTLTVDFDKNGQARRIVYAFRGNGPNEDAILRQAMLDHFGAPASDSPLTWCARPSPAGACPPNEPAVRFVEARGTRPVLTLARDDGG